MRRHQTFLAASICVMLATVGCVRYSPSPETDAPMSIADDFSEEQEIVNESTPENASETQQAASKVARATFGGGCFWCTEAVFQLVQGVQSVVSGYSGGTAETANYDAVCSGTTKHVEVVQITFDTAQIRFEELLEIFWKTHDPTTLNRQGADRGPQYRSVVFYHDERQKELAEKYKAQLDKSGAFQDPIVTAIEPFEGFYPSEEYHHDYFRRNPAAGYCQVVIAPKMEKFKQAFSDKLVDQKD